jgi:hypothetical protein
VWRPARSDMLVEIQSKLCLVSVGGRILINGLFRNLVSSLAHILGMQFVLNTTKWNGGI